MRKISFQKVFCFISFLFILSCCIFYGTRFIKFYLESKKIEIIEENTLAKLIRENNHEKENFKEINGTEYFWGNSSNNYILYSNILWRIIKINNDNSITIISDSALTSLANGEKLSYHDSYINKWLNKNEEEYSGILENNLNQKETYLQKTTTCLDSIDELSNQECKTTNKDYYISLLSVKDFLNTGSKDSFITNEEYFYLENSNSKNEIWNVTDEGKITTNKGTDILGIRPVITIKSNIEYISGDGTENNPYVIEQEYGLFGSYVKLDNDIWRIYQVNDTDVRLVLNDYLKVNNTILEYNYSQTNSYHNDTKNGSIAYYLNNNFLNSLSYKDKIKETTWSNGYYGNTSNYDYKTSLEKTVQSKVALISIADIKLNSNLNNYFTLTGTKENGTMVYVISDNQKLHGKNVQSKTKVVPAISLSKDLITKGNGTIDSPYEME